MSKPEVRAAAVIGTGMMGPGIAGTLALGGVEATILSRSAENARQALHRARGQIALLRERQLAGAEAADRACELLKSSTDFDASVAAADIVIESAPESMEFKQNLFARMDAVAKPECVLASNTSGLSITAIASKCQRPERVLTTHFWNPPHLMPLVEVVKGEKTSDEAAEAVRGLLARCGKSPVVVKKDTPGQLGNRLQMALVREAIHIVAEGIASVEDVDRAAKSGFGLRLPVYGIFEHQDIVGLDMGYSIVDYVSRDLYNQPRAPEYMSQLVAEGRLGVKSGRGFYDWSNKSADEVKSLRDRFVLDFLQRWRKEQ
jgi:3-hydroxybutyryl-CoA dehydrogenase